MEHDILIDDDGTIRYVYSDEQAAFVGEWLGDEIASQVTTRASHVEPHPTKPGWLADMRPSGGPILGLNGTWIDPDYADILQPFSTRQIALDAERAWLREHKGL